LVEVTGILEVFSQFLKKRNAIAARQACGNSMAFFSAKNKSNSLSRKKVNFAKNNDRNGVQNSLLFINNAKSVAVKQASIPAKNLHKS